MTAIVGHLSTNLVVDRATAYAQGVVDGDILAGEYVIAACQRHLNDLQRDDLVWDVAAAEAGIGWKEANLFIGTDPLRFFDWQCFLTGSIHGWKRLDGRRRFRRVYVETGKGSGKTPWAATEGCHLCFDEGEYRAEGYVIARTMEQALVTYRDAAAFVSESPRLGVDPMAEEEDPTKVRIMGIASPYNMVQASTNSFFKRLAANEGGAGRSGYRPHVAVIDEYHEHASDSMLEMMDKGTKARKQPLIIITTNSGAGSGSACGIEHAYAIAVATGERIDDSYLAYVCTMDKDDDLDDEHNWIKTNPSLSPLDEAGAEVGLSLPGREYIRQQLAQSKGIPSKRALVERLLFCKWSDAVDPWVDADLLDDLWIRSEDVDRSGECVGGIDLSSRKDMTAAALVWRQPDGSMTVEITAWSPEETLPQREVSDQQPYRRWVEEGTYRPPPVPSWTSCS